MAAFSRIFRSIPCHRDFAFKGLESSFTPGVQSTTETLLHLVPPKVQCCWMSGRRMDISDTSTITQTLSLLKASELIGGTTKPIHSDVYPIQRHVPSNPKAIHKHIFLSLSITVPWYSHHCCTNPLVNVYTTMERSTIFSGKTDNFNGHWNNSKL